VVDEKVVVVEGEQPGESVVIVDEVVESADEVVEEMCWQKWSKSGSGGRA